MGLRVEQWMMIGVVGLGGYAAYRLLTAPRDQAPLPPGPAIGPSTAPLPMLPVPVGSTALVDADTLTLRQGRVYGGRAESGQDAATFSTRLISMGFGPDAFVMLSPAEASGRVPDWALASPTIASRWFVGTWRGPTGVVPRPPDLVAAWATLPRA